MTRAAIVALLASLAVVAAGCGASSNKTSSGTQRRLTDLHNISQLQSAFDKASGEPRLVVLISPT